jgi:hypothetical protein
VWLALFRISERFPQGWSLVGGQMVHLHCAERNAEPHRTTIDGDTVVDIRADRNMLALFTQELLRLGFTSEGVSAEGHEHRWRNGDALIDVLIPTNLGRSQKVTGATGSTTVGTRGAQQALNRSELVEEQVGDSTGKVRRPNLVGALVIKGAAVSAPTGDPERHKTDFALLATMIRPSDNLTGLTTRDRQHLTHGIEAVQQSPAAHTVDGWQVAMWRLELAMSRPNTAGR